MGYPVKYATKMTKPKKVSTFKCYTKIFNQIKRLKCQFFIKRVLFKALVSLIENTPEQNNFLWLSMLEEWSELCDNPQQEKQVINMMRKIKLVFIDREVSEGKNKNCLSNISKLLFVRYFLGMLELQQEQHIFNRNLRVQNNGQAEERQ